MYVPTEEKARANKIKYIIDTCFDSLNERQSLYDMRRRFFLYGTSGTGAYGQQRVLYNRLMAHTDLVASFLYAADKVRFSIAAPSSAEQGLIKQVKAIEEDWNDEFRDTGLAYEFMEALQWALCYDSMFLKVGWNEARDDMFARLVAPHEFGVFDESETDLEGQEAFCHSYAIPYENAVLRLIRAGMASEIPRLSAVHGPQAATFPAVLSNMIITSTGGANLSGNVMGSVNMNYEPQAMYEPRSNAPKVKFKEVWVWDDAAKDYMMFIVAEPDIVLEDSRETIGALKKAAGKKVKAKFASDTNYFVAGEHPFVHVSPYRMLDYFWGEAHTDRVIPLQKWTNERLDQIHEILEMQVDPAKVFSGFMGLTDEKAGALGGPGTWVVDQLPGAKVDRLVPQMPEDLFAEMGQIGKLFLEASGLTETVTGRGEQGVRGARGGAQARQQASMGGSRIRKVAVSLEPTLVRLADISLKLKRNRDETRLMTEEGQEFVLAQVEPQWRMRVAGHSHSPLFSDESRDIATVLLKARAIDREMFVRLMHPPGEASIVQSLRQNIAKERQMIAANPALLQQKGKGKGNGAAVPGI